MLESNIEKLLREVEIATQESKMPSNAYQYNPNLKRKINNVLKDLEMNHNHSWAVEMFNRNKASMSKVAMIYRSNKITYEQMYSKAYQYACSLKKMGFRKGSEIPICVSNIPEFVSLFVACSFIGAVANIVGNWFDKDYLGKILEDSNSKFIFVSDDQYEEIASVIHDVDIPNIVMFSLTDSFKKDQSGKSYNPYEEVDSKFHTIENNVKFYKNTSLDTIISEEEFINLGINYKGKVVENCTLDDKCAITYTSGTTNPGCPKGVLHANRSYITLSRFKESDVSGMPTMRNLIILAHIPTYTHMQLSCAISDTLYCNCTLAMEPYYDKEFFPYSLLINKPNFCPGSVGFYMHLCKLLNYSEEFKNVNMPYLMIPTITGEACSPGEEKFFNETARKHKFGIEKLPFPLAPVTFSIGGGTSESSGIFVTLYKSLQEKRLTNILQKNTLGLTPHKFAEIEVLNQKGEYCEIGEPGLLVANSPCNMIGYTNEELNKKMYIIDAFGKTWLNLGTYAVKSDKMGRIKMKGRINSNIILSDGTNIPYYRIEDVVSLDTKNMMSCSLVKVDDKYICHIEMQPKVKKGKEAILLSCIKRLEKQFPEELLNNLYFRVRTFNESFSVAPSGKRDTEILQQEGITSMCISCNQLLLKTRNNTDIKKLIKK